MKRQTKSAFPDVPVIQYEGPRSKNPLAFKWYNPDEIVEGKPGSFLYTPKGIGHSFHVDSDEARVLLFFGPAGVEGFFREVATPARSFSLPPADEPVPDRETIIEIMRRHGQTVLGPPLPPK